MIRDDSFIRFVYRLETSQQTLSRNISVIASNLTCVLYLFLYTYEYVFSQRNNLIPSASCIYLVLINFSYRYLHHDIDNESDNFTRNK